LQALEISFTGEGFTAVAVNTFEHCILIRLRQPRHAYSLAGRLVPKSHFIIRRWRRLRGAQHLGALFVG
jgi:hypothetical protein